MAGEQGLDAKAPSREGPATNVAVEPMLREAVTKVDGINPGIYVHFANVLATERGIGADSVFMVIRCYCTGADRSRLSPSPSLQGGSWLLLVMDRDVVRTQAACPAGRPAAVIDAPAPVGQYRPCCLNM